MSHFKGLRKFSKIKVHIKWTWQTLLKKYQHMNIDGTKMIPSCNLKENPRISFVYFSKSTKWAEIHECKSTLLNNC